MIIFNKAMTHLTSNFHLKINATKDTSLFSSSLNNINNSFIDCIFVYYLLVI